MPQQHRSYTSPARREPPPSPPAPPAVIGQPVELDLQEELLLCLRRTADAAEAMARTYAADPRGRAFLYRLTEQYTRLLEQVVRSFESRLLLPWHFALLILALLSVALSGITLVLSRIALAASWAAVRLIVRGWGLWTLLAACVVAAALWMHLQDAITR